MRYFIVQGKIKNQDKMNDSIMKEHMAYSQKAMDNGLILMSGLKSDISGGVFIMKAESIKKVEIYLSNEPLKVNDIQDYSILEFLPHYFNQSPNEWFNK